MPIDYRPNDFDGSNVDDGFEIDDDSGFTDTVETITTNTAPFISPGEYWQISATLALNDDPGSGPMFLELRDDDDAVIARSAIAEFGGVLTELTVTVPAYVAGGEFSPPASSGASPEIIVNNVSGSTVNYFVNTSAVRLRDGIDQTSVQQNGSTNSFDSGQPN